VLSYESAALTFFLAPETYLIELTKWSDTPAGRFSRQMSLM
jgi:hypothetical protein